MERISPSVYEAALNCKARASWTASGDQSQVPQQPAAMLGRCFHAVVAAAHNGELELSDDAGKTSARERFDNVAQSLYDEAHPLLRVKFPTVERLPFYNLLRERAVLHASVSARPRSYSKIENTDEPERNSIQSWAESTLSSSDRLIVGRPDRIDEAESEVVDYKTGLVAEGNEGGVSESEARQLRLYAHLCLENNIRLSKGTIVRGKGQRESIEISTSDAQQEADHAKEALRSFNESVDRAESFDDLASPSLTSCRNCACIPFCDAFWEASDVTWADAFGVCLEGEITEISRSTSQGTPLLSVAVDGRRGTVNAGKAVVEQVPEQWITADSSLLPKVGDRVRVVNGRLAASEDPVVVRVDKTATVLWTTSSNK